MCRVSACSHAFKSSFCIIILLSDRDSVSLFYERLGHLPTTGSAMAPLADPLDPRLAICLVNILSDIIIVYQVGINRHVMSQLFWLNQTYDTHRLS